MTYDEIMALEVGPEMDAAVARGVFDATEWCPDDPDDALCQCERTPPRTVHCRDPLPEFSSDDAATLQVVDKMIARGYGFELSYGACVCNFWDCYFTGMGTVYGKTRGMAVCRAALLAIIEGT